MIELKEIISKDILRKLEYDPDNQFKLKITMNDLTISKNSINRTLNDICHGKTSKSSGNINVLYDIDKKKCIITDGWHRFVELLLNGLTPENEFEIDLYSVPYNDFYSIPSEYDTWNYDADWKHK
jgi:hypothetical protein